MAEPVVTMTKFTYFAWWAGVWAVTMGAIGLLLYFLVAKPIVAAIREASMK